MTRRMTIAFVVLALLLWGWFLLPNSLFYRDRRPTKFGRVTNWFMSWAASMGMPLQVTLEVRGRNSGRAVSTVLVPGHYGEEQYLVSMLGEESDWVRNVRAAGGDAVVRHVRRKRVRLEDVPVGERAPILKAYLGRAIGARPHFDVRHDADIAEFERVAHEYPVFRIAGETC